MRSLCNLVCRSGVRLAAFPILRASDYCWTYSTKTLDRCVLAHINYVWLLLVVPIGACRDVVVPVARQYHVDRSPDAVQACCRANKVSSLNALMDVGTYSVGCSASPLTNRCHRFCPPWTVVWGTISKNSLLPLD